jgi:hypothetical protein
MRLKNPGPLSQTYRSQSVARVPNPDRGVQADWHRQSSGRSQWGPPTQALAMRCSAETAYPPGSSVARRLGVTWPRGSEHTALPAARSPLARRLSSQDLLGRPVHGAR